jgi:hypothetical protein
LARVGKSWSDPAVYVPSEFPPFAKNEAVKKPSRKLIDRAEKRGKLWT